MPQLSALSDDDARTIAAAFGLGAVRSIRPIEVGTINSNFAFELEGGRAFIRVNEGKRAADVAWEADLVVHLAAAGVPTLVPLAAGGRRYLEHRGLLISAFAWREGGHRSAALVSSADAAAVGAALARLHAAGRTWRGQRRPGIYTWALIHERARSIQDAGRPELARPLQVLVEEMTAIDHHAGARTAVPPTIIHGDLFRDNVLFPDGGSAEDLTLLDFEQASWGSPAYDLAVALNDWCWSDGPRPELAAALVGGYQQQRPLDESERSALPLELRAAAVRFTITRITDVYLAGRNAPEKDYRAFLARVEAWRGGGAEALCRDHLAV